MGELKALLPWQGTTLLEHQLTALAEAGVSRTIVILGHQSERLKSLVQGRENVQWVYNSNYHQGKTTSVKTGVRAFQGAQGSQPEAPQEEAILLLNVDQPRSAGTIRFLMELHHGTDNPSLITVPVYQGKGGHPVILSTSLFTELLVISEETLGLKSVVRRHEECVRRVEMDSAEILVDLNTSQDYHRALDMYFSG